MKANKPTTSTSTTNHELYVQQQLADPEFRAHYALAREKARLEISLAELRSHVEQQRPPAVVLRDISRLARQIASISL
jgi:hypothetical protein